MSDATKWHALRARNIGSSEIAILFGCAPEYALSPFALWMVKAGRIAPPEVDNKRVRWGTRLEPVIADCAAEERGWKIEKAGYIVDPTTLGMGCTPDYLIMEPGMFAEVGTSGSGILELKNSDWIAHRRSWTNNEPPAHILLQLQHQLGCSGCTWGAVACLVGGNDLRIYDYAARPKIIAEIRTRVREFWRSVKAGEEPPIDGKSSTSEALRALYREPSEEVADKHDDVALQTHCAQYLHAKLAAADWAETAETHRNKIIAQLGNHRRAICDGFAVNLTVGKDIPDRPAKPGEIIKGRRGAQRLTVKETAV